MDIVPCTTQEEVDEAIALIDPIQLQDGLPDGYLYAFVAQDGEYIGTLMWPAETEMPTDISIAPTLLDNTYPNQNLYWGGE